MIKRKLFSHILSYYRILLSPEDTLELVKYKDENGRSISQMASLHSSHDWGALLTGE